MKVLVIAPKFFGYEREIISELGRLGATACYIDERPKNNFITKSIIRLKKEIIAGRIKKYHSDQLKQLGSMNFDCVLIINLEAMSPEVIGLYKGAYPQARFILYMWDSLKNKKNADKSFGLFDRVFSFDREDADLFKGVKFRPLFYVNSLIEQRAGTPAYDISFIGTIHSDRLRILEKVRTSWKNKKGLYYYMFLQSPVMFFKQKATNPAFKGARFGDFSYRSLTLKETYDIISKSGSVLDIQHPLQTGLTMRTLEVLGAGRKLLTTNAHIASYDFYNPANILIVSRDNPEINDSFVHTPFQPLAGDLLYKYSLSGWLEEILSSDNGI